MTEIDRVDRKRFVGVVTGYCNEQDCMTREVEIKVKNHFADRLAKLTCPVCGGKLDHVQAHEWREWENKRDEEARCRVNTQRYVRDHSQNGIIAIPFSVIGDDSLPK